MPDLWKEDLLIKLPKSGNLRCYNYRGVTLFSISEKVFCRMLLDRMKTAVDAKLRDEQAAFRKGDLVLTRFSRYGSSWSRHLNETLPDLY